MVGLLLLQLLGWGILLLVCRFIRRCTRVAPEEQEEDHW
ncbi:hypothetical protein FTUN_1327 [Frigoriglobus tundricola]|uniref:Uncharacterized protein n=1 Tax=Frigoriglobus tundricola TaxID=2774151 RepID=A0A6M5YKK5_9BACT|nr:hypothetical protein FTUN_1327 [Frigoriglobus tundricola]